MTVEIEIRRATIADEPALVALYHDAYAQNVRLGFPASAATVSLDEVAQWATNDHLYVALHQGEIVGAVRLKYYSEWSALVVGRLGVATRWKGRGIGSRLLAYAEAQAAQMGWASIRLTTPG